MGAYLVDIVAVGFFALEWLVYSITLEHAAYGRTGLSARMNAFREVWVRRMLDRVKPKYVLAFSKQTFFTRRRSSGRSSGTSPRRTSWPSMLHSSRRK